MVSMPTPASAAARAIVSGLLFAAAAGTATVTPTLCGGFAAAGFRGRRATVFTGTGIAAFRVWFHLRTSFHCQANVRTQVRSQDVFMAIFGLIEYADATPEVRAIYDEIMAARKTDYINNFWKALAHDPASLRRTWDSLRQVMAAGALDPLTKEMIYLAVSVTNQCGYCIASHTAAAQKAGMTPSMFAELMAVVGMANETNKLVTGWQVEVDERFRVT
jgi:AhpD family alkylhydroperoxidase